MGIKNFKKFTERQCGSNLETQMRLSGFSGKILAIDMANLIYIMCAVSTKNVVNSTNLTTDKIDQCAINGKTIDMVLGRLTTFMKLGITPVCVFDGNQSDNSMKAYAHKKRKDSRQTVKNKLETAKTNFETADTLFQTPALEIEYKKYLRQNVNVSWALTETIKSVLRGCGFPCFVAGDETNPGTSKDGEALCARLCHNNVCDLSFTIDSDYHTFGGTISISKMEELKEYDEETETFSKAHYVYHRSTENILESLKDKWVEEGSEHEFTFDTFRDACIMLGTDFNPNINKIGPVKVWQHLKKYGSVEGMKDEIDTSILNYDKVLEHFETGRLPLNIERPIVDVKMLRENSREILCQYGLDKYTTTWCGIFALQRSH